VGSFYSPTFREEVFSETQRKILGSAMKIWKHTGGQLLLLTCPGAS
jgi:hypothetical protein